MIKRKYLRRFLLIIAIISMAACGAPSDGEDGNAQADSVTPVAGLPNRPSNQTCLAEALEGPPASLAVERAFPNLSFSLPLALLQAPGDDGYWYVVEQSGKIRKFENSESTTEAIDFIDLTGKIILPHNASTGGLGLFNMVFHPDFQRNGKVYVYYSAPVSDVNYDTCDLFLDCDIQLVLSELTLDKRQGMLDPNSEKILLTEYQPWAVHTGGGMAFGSDGLLYLGIGDGGGDLFGPEAPQDLNRLSGKIIRIDVDRGNPYKVPHDNPFVQGGGLPEIYAWGLRNPWRMGADQLTGELWVADVGLSRWEEIDKVASGNFGWPIYEGLECRDGVCSDPGPFLFPDYQYNHSEGCAVIGGYVYRGALIPSLYGSYLFADLCSQQILGLTTEVSGIVSAKELLRTDFPIVFFGQDNQGEIYFTDYFGGTTGGIYRVTGLRESENTSIQLLSETGCYNQNLFKEPSSGLIPYDVNMPLWSDGAGKGRWIGLPDGGQIRIREDGRWEVPVGAVLVKNFERDGRLIETRLLKRHGENFWAGYSYEWDENQTDAILVPTEGKRVVFADGSAWTFPSQSQCLRCHNAATGRILGPETANMNRDVLYEETGITANQIRTFNHIGLLDHELSEEEIEAMDQFPMREGLITTGEELEKAARAYLHVNCAICHLPGGPGIGPENFRYTTPLNQMGACEINPTVSDLGHPDAFLLTPGNSEQSVFWLRMKALDENRMPPLATELVDIYGTEVVGQWIESLTSCDQ